MTLRHLITDKELVNTTAVRLPRSSAAWDSSDIDHAIWACMRIKDASALSFVRSLNDFKRRVGGLTAKQKFALKKIGIRHGVIRFSN